MTLAVFFTYLVPKYGMRNEKIIKMLRKWSIYILGPTLHDTLNLVKNRAYPSCGLIPQ